LPMLLWPLLLLYCTVAFSVSRLSGDTFALYRVSLRELCLGAHEQEMLWHNVSQVSWSLSCSIIPHLLIVVSPQIGVHSVYLITTLCISPSPPTVVISRIFLQRGRMALQ